MEISSAVSADTPPPTTQLSELITTLEQATQAAKQLTTSTNPSHHHLIYSSLQSAHQSLSSFLSNRDPHLLTTEHSSSAVSHSDAEPMQVVDGEDQEEEHSSRSEMDKMEEKMRNFCLQNKRLKRPLSPSSAGLVEQQLRQLDDNEFVRVPIEGFDPHGSMLRSLDLVYQFHG